MEILSTFITAIITFIVTNIDNLFILVLLFSQTDQSFRRRHVVIGQYLGFAALVAVSLIGFLGSFIIPKAWIGLLGLAPIAIGLHKLINRNSIPKRSEALGMLQTPPSMLNRLLNPKMYSVAIITFANGGDNIGIYTPLFASSDAADLIVILSVFLILVAVWCFIGYSLMRQPSVAQLLSHYGHLVVPILLIGLGIYIILENGTLNLLGL